MLLKTTSSALYITSHYKIYHLYYFLKCDLIARSNNTHFVKINFSKTKKSVSHFLALFNIITDGKMALKHCWRNSNNHLYIRQSQLILSKNITHIGVVVISTLYIHISSQNDIVNCDNCPATTHVQYWGFQYSTPLFLQNHQVP